MISAFKELALFIGEYPIRSLFAAVGLIVFIEQFGAWLVAAIKAWRKP